MNECVTRDGPLVGLGWVGLVGGRGGGFPRRTLMMLSHLPADWWSVRELPSLHLHQARLRYTIGPHARRSVIKISRKHCVFRPAWLNMNKTKIQFRGAAKL